MIRSSGDLRRAGARMSWLGLGLFIGCGLPVGPAPSQSKTASGAGSGPVANAASSPGSSEAASSTSSAPKSSQPATGAAGSSAPGSSGVFLPPGSAQPGSLTPAGGLPGGAASSSGASPPGGGSASSAARAQVRLSAGVALAQSLPSGTGMLFSVDYRFERGDPDQSTRYVWVITPRNGSPLRQEVQLNDRGTLQAIVERLEPEAGPFRCRLEALARGSSRPVAVSEEANMR